MNTWPAAIVQVAVAVAVAALGWRGVLSEPWVAILLGAIAGVHAPQLQRKSDASP